MKDITALNIGSGRDYRKEWINIDNKIMYHGDFKVDIEKDFLELEWKDNSVDFILLNHVVQYIPPSKMHILLKRWYGWLKTGGAIYIEAGDILKISKNILTASSIEQLEGTDCIMQLYGIDDNIWNTWAWCPPTMTSALDKNGFKNIFTCPGYFHKNPSRDFLTVAYKADELFIPPAWPVLINI